MLLEQKIPEFESTYAAIKYWDRKKERIRLFFAIAIIIFIVFGFEQSTPHYSLTSELGLFVADNVKLLSLFGDKKMKDQPKINEIGKTSANDISVINETNVKEAIKVTKRGSSIKYSTYGILILILMFAFVNMDPFSMKYLILNILDEDKYKRIKFLPNFKEILFYAKMVPSNALFFKCKDCRQSEFCENSLTLNRHKRIEIWTKMFLNFKVDFINENMKLVNQCRKWHFTKYSLLLAAFFLMVVYGGVRVAEYCITSLSVSINWQLLILIAISCFVYLLISKIDPSLNHLNDHLNIFYSSAFFFGGIQKICLPESGT